MVGESARRSNMSDDLSRGAWSQISCFPVLNDAAETGNAVLRFRSMSTSPHSSFVVPMLTGPSADLRLDTTTGVARSRERIFLPALRSAHHGFNSPGRLAPPAARGMQAWINGTEELRIRLGEFGWVVPGESVLDGAGFVLSPDGRTAIAMVSGDEATGLPGYLPQVKYARGQVSSECVQGNLFTGYAETARPIELHYLLHHMLQVGWNAELSQPAQILSGKVTGWRSRAQIIEDTPGGPDAPGADVGGDEASLPSPLVRWRDSA